VIIRVITCLSCRFTCRVVEFLPFLLAPSVEYVHTEVRVTFFEIVQPNIVQN
jgi:hypothetical protein